MASYVARKVGRKFLSGKLAETEPQDPHYEMYQDARGKQRKRKRAMPAGLSKRDERILRSVRRRAHYLDKGVSLCGFRVGYTFFLGLIPGAGDIAGFLLGYFLCLRKCREADLPSTLTQRMAFNQAMGFALGIVPLIGDIAMAAFKANSRNAALLEDFLIRRASTDSADVANAAEEERMARMTIEQGKIDKKTGEMRLNGAEGRAAAAREADAVDRRGTGPKYYGWNKGTAEPSETTATTGSGGAGAGYGATGTSGPTGLQTTSVATTPASTGARR
ncbi:hypothetical protein JCM10212_004511 [Sporobolomyces blumeae]